MVEIGGGGKDSVRSLALSKLDVARGCGLLGRGLRTGMQADEASEGSSVTYLFAR